MKEKEREEERKRESARREMGEGGRENIYTC